MSEGVVDEKPAAPVTTAEADAAHHDDEAPGIAEPDRINVGMILAITVAIFVSTLVVVIGVREFFSQTIRGEVERKVLEPEDPMKKELYVVEQAKLTKYQWVSQKDGVVRIPLARAKELVLADYGKMAAYQPGQIAAPAASSAEPVAPAPSASASVAPSASVLLGVPSAAVAPSASVPAKPSASAPHHH